MWKYFQRKYALERKGVNPAGFGKALGR